MTGRPGIVVIGSLNADLVVRTPAIPRPGETVIGRDFAVHPGGKGANQAVAAARAGGRVAMFGRVGADAFGEGLRAGLGRDGVDAAGVVVDPQAPTGVALICVDDRGENAIVVAPGANHRVGREDVARARGALEAAGCLVLQLEIPPDAVALAVAEAARAGVPVILNPAPAPPPDYPRERLLAGVAVVTPNEHEAAALAGLEPPGAAADLPAFAEAAARRIAGWGPRHVVITLGSHGAYWWDAAAGRGLRVPAFAVEPVDTTAAGDAFTGALAVALAEGRPFEQALRFAAAAGALAVTRAGAQPSLPRREEILALAG